MKKLKYLLTMFILMNPVLVNAAVDVNTPIGLFNTDAECRSELAKNDRTENLNATTGYYLSCIAVSCGTNERISHEDVEPFANNITCANGNPSPYKKSWKTAIPTEGELALGGTCSLNEEDEDFIMAQFATKVEQYNCLQTTSGDIYQGTTVNNPNNNGNNNNNGSEVTNPQTGINTYYAILGSVVVVLSLGLYIINKKNLFKKI